MNITKKFLEKEYCVKLQNTSEIAKKCNVKPKRIVYLMNKFGIPRRTKSYSTAHRLEGKRFGLLTVIRRLEPFELQGYQHGSHWLCECRCGNQKIAKGVSLVADNVTSCGCIWKSASYEELSGAYIWNLKNNAKLRGFEFSVEKEYLWDLFLKQGRKCNLSGVDLKFGDGLNKVNQTASLDRIDSSKGYIKGNVQWVHKTVNKLKNDFDEKDFLNWIDVISKHQKIRK